jgi:hypothetical protein
MQAARTKIFAACASKCARAHAIGTLARKIKPFCEHHAARCLAAEARRLFPTRGKEALRNPVDGKSAQLARTMPAGETLAAFC